MNLRTLELQQEPETHVTEAKIPMQINHCRNLPPPYASVATFPDPAWRVYSPIQRVVHTTHEPIKEAK